MNRSLLGSVGLVGRRRTQQGAQPGDQQGSFSIEPMRRRHVRAILDIEQQVYPKPWTSGVFTSEIDQVRFGSRYYVIGVAGTRLVGYGGLLFAADEAHVTNIAVDPNRRREGFARRILGHLAETAIERGAQALTLEVRVSNEAALGLYRDFGFAPAGIRQRYYENSEDALVMWAHDIQEPDFARRLQRARGERS